jgi:hypothetical protein
MRRKEEEEHEKEERERGKERRKKREREEWAPDALEEWRLVDQHPVNLIRDLHLQRERQIVHGLHDRLADFDIVLPQVLIVPESAEEVAKESA